MARGKLGANLISNVAFFALNIVVSLWLVSYLVRHLGVAAYGMVPLAVTIAGYFNVITAGLNSAVGRHLTVALGAKDFARASGVYNSALWAASAVALLMCALGVPMLAHIADWIEVPAGLEAETGWLFYLTLIGLALTTLGTPFQAIVYSRNRFDLQNLGNILALVSRVVVVVGLFVVLEPHIWHVGMSVVAAAAMTLATVIVASRRLEPAIRPRLADFSWPLTRELTGTGGWIFISQIGTLLLVNIDLLVANKVVGAAAAGRYALVLQWSLLLRNFALMIVGVFGPTMMLLYAEGRIDDLVRYANRSVRFMGLAMALPVGLVCGLSGPILNTWLGSDYVALALVMVLVTGHLGLNLAYLPLSHIPTATNRVKWPGIVQVIAGLVNLVAAIVLARWLGLIGIALAGGSVLLLRNTLFTPLYAARVLDRPLMSFVKGAVPLFLASLLVGLVAWGAAELLHPYGWLALAGVAALVAALYLLAVWVALLSREERELLVGIVRSKLRRSADMG